MEQEARHQCLIYAGPPSEKLRLLSGMIKRKLGEGLRCLYLNSSPMVAGMRSTLASIGVDVEQAMMNSSLVLSSKPVSSGVEFNPEAMLVEIESALNSALKDGFRGLWASGDMTWEFGPERNFSKLVEYELKLEELFQRRTELSGVCQYHCDTLPKEVMRQSLFVHPAIVLNDTLSRVNPFYLKSTQPSNKITNLKIDELIISLCEGNNS